MIGVPSGRRPRPTASTARSDPYDGWVPFLLYLSRELKTISAL